MARAALYNLRILQMVDVPLRQELYNSVRDKPASSFRFLLLGH